MFVKDMLHDAFGLIDVVLKHMIRVKKFIERFGFHTITHLVIKGFPCDGAAIIETKTALHLIRGDEFARAFFVVTLLDDDLGVVGTNR